MYELTVTVSKILGKCTADPPMAVGDCFTVRDGHIRIPEGGYVCLWALQNLLPVITPKERAIAEKQDQDWMWRVHHVQCPDPEGRVIWQIERTGVLDKAEEEAQVMQPGDGALVSPCTACPDMAAGAGPQHSLRVVVEEVGKCTSGLRPGDHFCLHSGRLYIPANRHFCLYALQAVLPFLPAKQRRLEEGDWLRDAHHIICPDPAGNVILRIEPFSSV